MIKHEKADEVVALVEVIKPLLAGKDPDVQAAVLAELLSLLLAGHWIPNDSEGTVSLRAAILAQHCMVVRQLTELNAKMIGTN